jgi:cytoskeletal protein RodZ
LQVSARSMGTVGEKLREARERSKRSLRDMSEQTKIRADHLEALEEGRYEVFSAPVYIRGFVRSYAGALKLNVAEVLSALDDELGQTERFSGHPPLTDEKKGAVDWLMLQLSKVNWTVALPLLLLALILLIAVFSYRIYTHSKTVDPLKDLGPGLYKGQETGETLPVPGTTN